MSRVRTLAGMLAVVAVAATVSAETAATGGTMLRMQPGESVFTILDTSGVRPLAGSALSVRDIQDGATVVEAVANEQGRAVVQLTEGRFILNVDRINLSVLDVSVDAEHSECRIVMPSQDLLVGGQADDDEEGDLAAAPLTLGSRSMTPVIIGGAVVLVAGAAYAIHETTRSGSRSKDADDPETIVTTTRQTIYEKPAPTPYPGAGAE